MSWRVPVYHAEVEANVADLVRACRSVACFARPEVVAADERAVALLGGAPEGAKASLEDFDLAVVRSVLASTGWNLNDDVFWPPETFAARHTPVHKPFNFEHDQRNVIGHAVSSVVVARDGTEVPDDAAVDDLPDDFDVVNSDVVYLRWEDPERQAWVDKVMAEVKAGEWMVSMEALFRDFDYAVVAPDGSNRIVARGRETAHMTAHLRAYGGTGEFEGHRVGRLMRGFVFSGKGLVADPGNPRSVILASSKTQPFISPVYEVRNGPTPKPQRETGMAEKNDEVEALRADLRESEKAGRASSASAAEAEKRAAEAESLAKATADKLAKSEADLKAAADALAKATADLDAATKGRDALAADLAAANAKLRSQSRASLAAAALKAAPTDPAVESLVDDLDEVSDAKFDAALARLAPAATPAAVENSDAKNLDGAEPAKATAAAGSAPSDADGQAALERSIANYMARETGDE